MQTKRFIFIGSARNLTPDAAPPIDTALEAVKHRWTGSKKELAKGGVVLNQNNQTIEIQRYTSDSTASLSKDAPQAAFFIIKPLTKLTSLDQLTPSLHALFQRAKRAKLDTTIPIFLVIPEIYDDEKVNELRLLFEEQKITDKGYVLEDQKNNLRIIVRDIYLLPQKAQDCCDTLANWTDLVPFPAVEKIEPDSKVDKKTKHKEKPWIGYARGKAGFVVWLFLTIMILASIAADAVFKSTFFPTGLLGMVSSLVAHTFLANVSPILLLGSALLILALVVGAITYGVSILQMRPAKISTAEDVSEVKLGNVPEQSNTPVEGKKVENTGQPNMVRQPPAQTPINTM